MVVCDIQGDNVTRSGWGMINKATSDLRLIDATPEQIDTFYTWWLDEYVEATITPAAIAKNWHQCWDYKAAVTS